MTNEQLAATFDRIASLMEIQGEVIYKTLAYRRAAETLRMLGEDIAAVRAEGRLLSLPGVGKAIAEKIEELLGTGSLGFLERLEDEVPPSLLELLEVPDVGPKKVALFWKQAGITSLAELGEAARAGRLRDLPGLGEKSEARILAGIEALGRRSKRLSIHTADRIARRWLETLRAVPGVERIEAAGSLRRRKSTIGDLDFVAASREPAALMAAFTSHREVEGILGQGENKSSVEIGGGLNIQLWVQPPERFGTLLQFVSGSKDHNVRLRELAQKQGLSLSERAIQKGDGGELIFADEASVYAALGLPIIPPELREDRGEIQAAQAGRLPRLVERGDIRADFHCHSTFSDGSASIEEMARAAVQRGLQVLAITDHSAGLAVAGGLSVERLAEQRAEIERVQALLGGQILLLQGSEVEILSDGSLGYPDEVLAQLDLVIASLHFSLRQPREVITARLIGAMRNPHVDIIGHPSGRLLPEREGADLDWDAVLAAAAETQTALEIDANPSRLDLDEVYARRAAELGVLLTVDTDAHSPNHLDFLDYGLAVARRAWLEPRHILNCREDKEILDWLRERKG